MRMARACLLACVSACAFAPAAAAYQCTLTEQAASIAWERRELVMRPTARDGDEVTAAELREALEHGATEWSAPSCSDLAMTVGEVTQERRAGFDYRAGKGAPSNQNVVVFRKGGESDPLDEWIHLDSNLAITTVTYLRSTAELLDADIEINDAGFFFTACDPPGCQPRHDLKNALTHELGHVVGLDHPPSSQPGATSATMFATASEGDVGKRDLADDDVDGLCTLYPAGEPSGDCGSFTPEPPPSVRVSRLGGCAASRPGAPAALCLLLAAGAAARRRRRTHTAGD